MLWQNADAGIAQEGGIGFGDFKLDLALVDFGDGGECAVFSYPQDVANLGRDGVV